ncbi:MAG: hypothetical protein ACLQDV_00770 [Candidatus Binataceae bacterium]
MPKQLKDPKLRSADLAIRLMTTTAEHVRDCPRCYEILVRAAGEKLGEINAARPEDQRKPEGSTGFHITDFVALMPYQLWPIVIQQYHAFVACDHWPGVDLPDC